MKISIDAARVQQVLARFPVELDAEVRKELLLSGEAFVSRMQDRFRGYTGTQGDLLQNRRGQAGLRGSFGYEVSGSLGSGSAISLVGYSAGRAYARIQEYGGEVVPLPPRRYLTIPIADNITPGGDVRYKSAQELRTRYPGQTYIRRTEEGLFIFSNGKPGAAPRLGRKKKDGSRGAAPKPETLLLFKLVTKVRIPPRLGMRQVWTELADDHRRRLGNAAERAAARALSS